MPRFLRRLLAPAGRPPARTRWLPPRVEPLEDRCNPVAVDFVPFAVTAINPSPLPATALMQFNPLPDLRNIPAAGSTFVLPVNIQGTFLQTITRPTATGKPGGPLSPTFPGTLTVSYTLRGTVTETITPANAAGQPGTFSATFSLSGPVTEVFQLPGGRPQPAYTISNTFSETGSVSGPLTASASSTTGLRPMTFTLVANNGQTEQIVSPTATAATTPWSVQATVKSNGAFQLSGRPPDATTVPVTLGVPFSLTDQIGETLKPVTSSTLPQPAIQVTAGYTAGGTVTNTLYPPAAGTTPTTLPPRVNGAEQYHGVLNETIVFPPGPTQPGYSIMLTQAFDTTGLFQYASGLLPPALRPGVTITVL